MIIAYAAIIGVESDVCLKEQPSPILFTWQLSLH
jgi:hypothetical protein